jgi:hypothetical protein
MKCAFKTILISLFMLCFCHLAEANDTTQEYIQQYKSIAINEMKRVRIPASIKMAQAILESSSGRSTLARQSKNHFGIKCGGGWTGKEVYREDDDYKNGLLIRSCFRAYGDPAESFYAHSDFLANPKSTRYKSLFLLDPYDYKGWAKGLRKAGYATDPKYPSKLISLIEKYELYLLDYGLVGDVSQPLVINKPNKPSATVPEKNMQREHTSQDPSRTNPQRTVIASTTTSNIGSPTGFHKVQSSDRMADIASMYRISTQDLYVRNRLPNGSEPMEGEFLSIDHYIHFSKKPKFYTPDAVSSTEIFLWEESLTVGSDD